MENSNFQQHNTAPLTLKSRVALVIFIEFFAPRWRIGSEMVNILMIRLPFCFQAKKICEVGLEVGSSSISCLGDPSMGKW